GAGTHDAVDRTRIVTEPRQRGLDRADQPGSAWRRSVILALIGRARIGIAFGGAGDETDAGADSRTRAGTPAAADDAADDGSGDAALHATLDDLRFAAARRSDNRKHRHGKRHDHRE